MRKSVIIPLITINVIMFFLQMVTGLNGGLVTEMLKISGILTILEPWRLVTSMFLHASVTHLFFNMYALFLFGPLVEQRIGPKRFLGLYLLTGVLAAFIGAFIYDAALGASGAIMGIIGVLVVLNPDLKLLLFFVLPMSLRTAGILWIIIDIVGMFQPNGIANAAHLVGMAVGLVYGFNLVKKKKKHRSSFRKKTMLDDDDIEDYIKYGRI